LLVSPFEMDAHSLDIAAKWNLCLEEIFSFTLAGVPDRKAEDEAIFNSMVNTSKPNVSQLQWIHQQIFDHAKRASASNPAMTAPVFDKVSQLTSLVSIRLIKSAPSPQVAAQNANNNFSLFFPDDPTAFNRFYGLLKSAKKSMDICVFTITDDRIADTIMKAHSSGVTVRIISDDEKAEDLGADIHKLRNFGIPVHIDNSPAHMHHKFAIIDNAILINGSFNWTRSASDKNNENVQVTDNFQMICEFRREFERLWKKFGSIDG